MSTRYLRLQPSNATSDYCKRYTSCIFERNINFKRTERFLRAREPPTSEILWSLATFNGIPGNLRTGPYLTDFPTYQAFDGTMVYNLHLERGLVGEKYMEPERFSKFRHKAVHELMDLNESCEKEYRISSWPKWEYDLDRGTLAFTQDGVPKVLASIEVVGTTSISGGTWLWGWANESLTPKVTTQLAKVRAFGEAENISELTNAELPDDEYLGWEMTAVAAKLLGAKGAYRCPGENGFVYVVYSSIGFADDASPLVPSPKEVECSDHGRGFATYACEHLVSNPAQAWHSSEPDEENKWPDAWCDTCEVFLQQQGEWNEKNESKMKIKLLCHHCYELLRSQERPSVHKE